MEVDISTGSAFLLGLLGTGHCIGMCGPLVAIFPGRYHRGTAHLVYHAGRITTYGITGAVLGAIGAGLAYHMDGGQDAVLHWTARLQIIISALSALMLMGLGLIRLGLIREPGWMAGLAPWKIPGYQTTFKKISSQSNILWLFPMGLILGWLPCGLSYAAFARALAARSIPAGALLTLAFGAGTLPGLLVIGTGAGALWRRYRGHMEMAAGLLMIAMAVALFVDILAGG